MTPSEQTFEPISPNPFITGNPVPVGAPYLFVGREDNFTRVRQRLLDETEGIVLLFVDERRSGKTSILFYIRAGRLGGKFLPVFIDMQQIAGEHAGDQQFFAHLAERTLEQTEDERLTAGLEYYDFEHGIPSLALTSCWTTCSRSTQTASSSS